MIASKPVTLARTTVTASAVEHLRAEIIAGRLPPGEALPEARVGALLGVSRAPVREALTLLKREGLVAFDHRGAARVCVMERADIRELGVMRLALEPKAARLACECWQDKNNPAFEMNLHSLLQAQTLPDVAHADMEFHRLVLRASGNRRLLAAWEGLAAQFLLVMTRFHQAIEGKTGLTRQTNHRAHDSLLNGLQSGRPDYAEILAHEHAKGWIIEYIQPEQSPAPKEAI